MDNYDDKIIIDDEVEVKFEQKPVDNEIRKAEVVNYSNSNVRTENVFQILFSKKYLALTLASLSILLVLFLKFLVICGVSSHAFLGIWFFICMGLSGAALILNLIYYAKNKKVDFNVSTIITILSLICLFLI